MLPNVQTVAEAGVANYEASLLFGLIAPAGLPPAVLAKLNAEVVRIINAPQMLDKLAKQGVVPIASKPDEFTATMKPNRKSGRRSSRRRTSRNSRAIASTRVLCE